MTRLYEHLNKLVLIAFAIAVLFTFFMVCSIKTARADVLSIAQQEIGHGEQGRDNCGPDIRKYLHGQEGLPWCAAFVSYCLQEAGLKTPYYLRARNYLKVGTEVVSPAPGDIIIFWRGSRNGQMGHVGIVEKIGPEGITTIEGNVGPVPAKVKRITYKNRPVNLLAYIRITHAQKIH